MISTRWAVKTNDDYRRAIKDPATVHAMIEDYRAGLDVDRMADEADMTVGRKVACPTLVLCASRSRMRTSRARLG